MAATNAGFVNINSDLGESFGPWVMGNDAEVLKIVKSANVACGFHASDPVVMVDTVALCQANGVSIGAHPSFADLQGFGRRAINLSVKELEANIAYQLGALQAIAAITRDADTLLIVDAITSCGTMPLEMDAWGVDIVATGSQKAFMLPPGLAMVAVSDKAWAVIDTIPAPTLYLDLKAYRKAIVKNSTPYTSAVSLIRGLKVAVDMLNEVGIERVWARTALLAKATRAAAGAIGLTLASESPSDSVTAICLPDGIDDGIRKHLRETYGVSVAGGQEDWKGKVIRINHMGYTDPFDTLGGIGALEYALRDLGYAFEIGAGVAAAAKVLADWS